MEDLRSNHLGELQEDGYTSYRNASEEAKTPAYRVGGVDHDHNTVREDRVGLVGSCMDGTEREGAVEVGDEVADENAIVAGGPAHQMEVLEEEVGPTRPLEVVHDHS